MLNIVYEVVKRVELVEWGIGRVVTSCIIIFIKTNVEKNHRNKNKVALIFYFNYCFHFYLTQIHTITFIAIGITSFKHVRVTLTCMSHLLVETYCECFSVCTLYIHIF